MRSETTHPASFRLLGNGAVRGHVVGVERGDNGPEVVIRIEDGGTTLHVRTPDIGHDAHGVYYLPVLLAAERPATLESEQSHIPVAHEELHVGKRSHETGGVIVNVRVHEREEVVDLPLMRDEVEIMRVPVNEVIAEPPAMRSAGDVLVIPVLEEIQVVEKRLILKEEIHIRRKRHEEHAPQRIRLRSEEAVVERRSDEPDVHDT